MLFRICKSFKFSAAHILESSWSEKCQEIHGHNYIVEVVVESTDLNKDGMVIDFGKLKSIIKPLIEKFDHSFIQKSSLTPIKTSKITNEVFMDLNPTSENIARLIYLSISNKLSGLVNPDREHSCNGYKRTINLVKVRIYETDSSWSEYIG